MKLQATPQLNAPQFGMSYKSLFYALPLLFLTGGINPDADTFQSQQESDRLSLVDQKQNARLDTIEARQLPQKNHRSEVTASRSDNTIQNAASRFEKLNDLEEPVSQGRLRYRVKPKPSRETTPAATRVEEQSNRFSSVNYGDCDISLVERARQNGWFANKTDGWDLRIANRDPFEEEGDRLHNTGASETVAEQRLIDNAPFRLSAAQISGIREAVVPYTQDGNSAQIDLCDVVAVYSAAQAAN
jgi:hypothetical protein